MSGPTAKLATDDRHRKSGSMVRDVLAYGLQSVLPQLLGFLLLPVFTNVLTPDDYAAVNLASIFAMAIAGVASLQLPSVVARFYFDCEEHDVASLFSTIYYSTAIVLSVAVGVVAVAGEELVGVVFPNSAVRFFPLYFLTLIAAATNCVASVGSTLMQVQRKPTLLLRISLLVAVLHFGVSLLFVVVWRWGPVGVGAAMVASAAFNLALVTFAVREQLRLSFHPEYLTPGLQYCLPLIPHFVGGFLFASSDKVVLEKFVTLAEVGVYAVAVKLVSPLNIFVDAFNRSASPRFMEASKKSKDAAVAEFREIITQWVAFVATLWIGLSLFAEEAVLALTPASYHGAISFLPILAAAYIFRGLYYFAVNPLFYEKKTSWVPLITVVAGVANVVMNIYLIPRYGVVAAAWTTLVSYAITFFMALLVASRFYPLAWNCSRILAIGIAAVGFVLVQNLVTLDWYPSRVAFKSVLCILAVLTFALLADVARSEPLSRFRGSLQQLGARGHRSE